MIECIYFDENKKSRDINKRLIKKIRQIRLATTFTSLNSAATVCKEDNINILFINLHDSPVPVKDITLLQEIMKNGTQIIIMSSKIGVAWEAFAFNADFVMLPTTTTRLLRTIEKALKIAEPKRLINESSISMKAISNLE